MRHCTRARGAGTGCVDSPVVKAQLRVMRRWCSACTASQLPHRASAALRTSSRLHGGRVDGRQVVTHRCSLPNLLPSAPPPSSPVPPLPSSLPFPAPLPFPSPPLFPFPPERPLRSPVQVHGCKGVVDWVGLHTVRQACQVCIDGRGVLSFGIASLGPSYAQALPNSTAAPIAPSSFKQHLRLAAAAAISLCSARGPT